MAGKTFFIVKLLITGICGFAGSIIAREILQLHPAARIVGLDSLIRRGSETNVESLRALGIDVRIGDIRDAAAIDALPVADFVIDCAANPSVLAGVDGKTSAKELLDHNLLGTIHLLEYCRRHGAGFILLSTSRVYAIEPLASLPMEARDNAFVPCSGQVLPAGLTPAGVNERFSTEPPLSLYGSSKKCSELLALEYGLTFGFPVYIDRCGVLAGAGQFGKADQGIFSYWIHAWATRQPLKYIGFGGTGRQVRDCLHPRDLAPLLVKQIQSPPSGKTNVINLAGGVENSMSLAQLSDWCLARFGPHEVTADLTPRPYDIPWMVLDSTQAFSAWAWKPRTSLEDILQEIAAHAEANPRWLQMVA